MFHGITLFYSGAYYSERLFSASNAGTILLVLLLAVVACLPAAVAFRYGEKKLALGCLALGAIGVFILIPWVAAVVLVVRQVDFQDRQRSSSFRRAALVYGIALVVYGAILLMMGINAYSRLAALYQELLGVSVSNGILSAIGICIIGVVTLLCALTDGKGFWGWNMALPVLLVFCVSPLSLFTPVMRYMGYLILLGGAAFICWKVYEGTLDPSVPAVRRGAGSPPVRPRPAVRQAGSPRPETKTGRGARSFETQGNIYCMTGQYTGAMFPVKSGESVCFGSDPGQAHLIIDQPGIRPVHMEIAYQADQGNYRVTHRADCPVYLEGYGPLGECMMVPPGSQISIGAPPQTFQLM